MTRNCSDLIGKKMVKLLTVPMKVTLVLLQFSKRISLIGEQVVLIPVREAR